MSKKMTAELVAAKSKCDNLSMVRNLNLWGNDIEDVSILREMPNVEVLSLSVNQIASLKEFGNCPRLQELYLRKNNITDLSEIRFLAPLQGLKVLWLWDNPIAEKDIYRPYIIKNLPNLVKLDNTQVTPEEKQAAQRTDFSAEIAAPAYNATPSTRDRGTSERNGGAERYAPPQPVQRGNSDYGKSIQFGENEAPPPPRRQQYQEQRETVSEYHPPQSNMSTGLAPRGNSISNENVLTAVLALLKELDESSLEMVRRDIDRKLGNLRNKY
eukprot:TRINITY_DN3235_c0_g2_i1.p1 TRINITY_DN3235_c0_g2~~TRINITY_DN3235_c0_g2_i1.p1  ORF type:complete len:270 (+),score=47.89 TRINITY_DN3235_c0_g2_i1:118-927(+)